MPSTSPKNALVEAGTIITVWKTDPTLKYGRAPDNEQTLVSFTALRDKLKLDADAFAAAEIAVEVQRDQLADEAGKLHAEIVRARESIKVHFGANSPEYDQAGGTRTSEQASGLHRLGALPAPTPPPSA